MTHQAPDPNQMTEEQTFCGGRFSGASGGAHSTSSAVYEEDRAVENTHLKVMHHGCSDYQLSDTGTEVPKTSSGLNYVSVYSLEFYQHLPAK